MTYIDISSLVRWSARCCCSRCNLHLNFVSFVSAQSQQRADAVVPRMISLLLSSLDPSCINVGWKYEKQNKPMNYKTSWPFFCPCDSHLSVRDLNLQVREERVHYKSSIKRLLCPKSLIDVDMSPDGPKD